MSLKESVKKNKEKSRHLPCPECGDRASSVIDCRPSTGAGLLITRLESKTLIRRRRECTKGHRFTTVEINIEQLQDMIKRDEVMRAAIEYIDSLREEVQ